MAEQNVVIHVGAELSSSYEATIRKINQDLSGLSGLNFGKGGSSGGRTSSAMSQVEKSQLDMVKAQKKYSSLVERTSAYLSSFLMGNKSSFNMLGIMRGVSDASASKSSGTGSGASSAAGAIATSGVELSLESILSVLVEVLVAVGAIFLILQIFKVIMDGINYSLKPVFMVLGVISKILGAMMIPLTLVLMQALLPLIWLMTPFIKLFSMILKPWRTYLIAAQKVAKEKGLMGFEAGSPFSYGAASLLATQQFFQSTFLTVMVGLADVLKGAFTSIFTTMMSVIGALVEPILRQIPVVGNNLADQFHTMLMGDDGLMIKGQDAIASSFDGIKAVLVAKINEIQDAARLAMGSGRTGTGAVVKVGSSYYWQTGIGQINKLGPSYTGNPSVDIPANIGYSENNVSIPGYATGGYVPNTGLALLHAGETVIPASKGDMGSSSSNMVFNFNVDGNVDERTARQMTDLIKRVVATEMRSIAR